MIKVAINGFGRIGRAFFRMTMDNTEFDVVAINDLGDIENLAYLLKYDTVYGRGQYEINTTENFLIINKKKIQFIQEPDPKKLPWGELDIDIVIESTGIFSSYGSSKKHLDAGAKKVIISGPVQDDAEKAGVAGATVLMGVNDEILSSCDISSNASCTTNAVSPLISILKDSIGIEKAILNTVHAYTSTQSTVDEPQADFRKGRAAAQNIIPTSTGAAKATTVVHTELQGKFDGISIRVPVAIGSLVDVTFIASKNTTAKEINDILTKASLDTKWRNFFAVTNEPLVSSDIIGARLASIADLEMTRVVDGNLVKILAWYDNETSFTHTLVEHVSAVAKVLNTKI